MKKKANGVFWARIAARGFEQIPGKHFDANSLAAPVVTNIAIRLVLTLIAVRLSHAEILDVIGAFLNGRFKNFEAAVSIKFS